MRARVVHSPCRACRALWSGLPWLPFTSTVGPMQKKLTKKPWSTRLFCNLLLYSQHSISLVPLLNPLYNLLNETYRPSLQYTRYPMKQNTFSFCQNVQLFLVCVQRVQWCSINNSAVRTLKFCTGSSGEHDCCVHLCLSLELGVMSGYGAVLFYRVFCLEHVHEE